MSFLVPRTIAEMARLKEAALNSSGGTAMDIDERSEWEAVEHCTRIVRGFRLKSKEEMPTEITMMFIYDNLFDF